MSELQEAYEFLLALPRYDKRGGAALRPGFERIAALLSRMNNPEQAYRKVLVAGTNGKGSTASMIASIGTAHGVCVGLHTSPHIHRVTERMRVDGKEADAQWLGDAITRYRPAIETIQPSFFEATLALSLLFFADRSVEMAVVEVGLGGRLDATNVLNPVACAIAQIGFDHMDFLGDTLPEIAGEKAGILKPGIPAFTNNTDEAVLQTIRARAEAVGAPLQTTNDIFSWCVVVPTLGGTWIDTRSTTNRYSGMKLGLRGRYQADNALLALAVAEQVYASRLDVACVADGLSNVERLSGLSGRLQVIRVDPLIVADAAHNPSGVQSALNWLADVAPRSTRFSAVLGFMRDKAVDDIVSLLAPRLLRVYPVELASERGLSAQELGRRFEATGKEPGSGPRPAACDVRYLPNVEAAMADFRDDPPAPSQDGAPAAFLDASPETMLGTIPGTIPGTTQGIEPERVLLITGSHYLLEQLPHP